MNTKEDFEANAVYAEMLVESYSDAKAYEKAKLLCLALLEYAPNEIHYMYLLANRCMMLEEYGEAISIYEQAIFFEKEAKEKTFYYYAIGECYSSLGRYKKAIAAYKRALPFEWNADIIAFIWNDLACAYVMRGKRRRALAYVRKALAIDPGNTYFIDTLAQTYAKMEQYDKALHCYQKIAKIDDTFEELEEKIVEMERLGCGEEKREKSTAGKR